jgi:uncharacterized membrane protein
MKKLKRLLKHLFFLPYQVRNLFPKSSLKEIELVIQDSEKRHSAELVFAVEGRLSISELLKGKTSRQRAIELFSILRVWDTEGNSGVLVYLLLADKKIEIVADRGISKLVSQSTWDGIIERMQENFRKDFFQRGVILGIAEITELLVTHFPPQNTKKNELSDKPIIL